MQLLPSSSLPPSLFTFSTPNLLSSYPIPISKLFLTISHGAAALCRPARVLRAPLAKTLCNPEVETTTRALLTAHRYPWGAVICSLVSRDCPYSSLCSSTQVWNRPCEISSGQHRPYWRFGDNRTKVPTRTQGYLQYIEVASHGVPVPASLRVFSRVPS